MAVGTDGVVGDDAADDLGDPTRRRDARWPRSRRCLHAVEVEVGGVLLQRGDVEVAGDHGLDRLHSGCQRTVVMIGLSMAVVAARMA